MIPLWTTATRSVQSVCGCAFSSVGGPCVDHRVWPIPCVWSADSGRIASSALTSPAVLYTDNASPVSAIPAESYPRYSRFDSPAESTGRADRSPA